MKSLEFDKDQLTDRVKKAEKDLKTYKDKLTACEKLAIASAQKSNFNEQYSRKNNIKILNIPEGTYETERTLTEVVTTALLAKGNVDLDPQDIIAIHRIPGKTGLPKPVLLKLKNNCQNQNHAAEKDNERCWAQTGRRCYQTEHWPDRETDETLQNRVCLVF